jgi:ketosteroid isomerase-like protein
MNSEILVSRVEDYFAAVDRHDLAATLSFFTPQAVFTIATFDVVYRGRDSEIAGMFERLFARYERIWHGDFKHVVQQPDRLATRFAVENRMADGQTFRKNNCNFFYATGESFHEVFVFMSGDNALR